MQSTAAPEPPSSIIPPAEDNGQIGVPGRILLAVFEVLDRAGIAYCVTHGYESYPQRIGSDVDCVIDRRVTSGQLIQLLARNSVQIGAEVVRCTGSHIVLTGRNADGTPCFLTLDVSTDSGLDGVCFYDGAELLESRRRHGQFWAPAAKLEFGCYLAGSVAKGRLDDARVQRLSWLYRQDASGCEQQVARFWDKYHTALIVLAAGTGDWEPVRRCLGDLQSALRRRAILHRPARFIAGRLHGLVDRMQRIWRPDGVYLVVLGPDGAGKSSVIDALPAVLAGAFPRFACYGFTPAVIHRLRHGAYSENGAPHGLPPRSLLQSVVRAVCYWFVYYTFGYTVRHLDLARSTLVLNDRHFVDVLVDPRRYRYGGPMWLVRLIWRIIPKPDLVVLLDAPSTVLQSRKQEVPFDETARQRREYLALVRRMPDGHVVHCDQPLEDVAADVSAIVVRHCRARVAQRFGLAQNALSNRPSAVQDDSGAAVPPMTTHNPTSQAGRKYGCRP